MKAAGWKVVHYTDTSVVPLADEVAKSASALSKSHQIYTFHVASEHALHPKALWQPGLARAILVAGFVRVHWGAQTAGQACAGPHRSGSVSTFVLVYPERVASHGLGQPAHPLKSLIYGVCNDTFE